MENCNFKNRISYLIIVSMQGVASEDEEKELQLWINRDEENKNLYNKLINEDSINRSLQGFQRFNSTDDWNNVKTRLKRNNGKNLINRRLYSGIAAAVSIIFICFIYNQNQSTIEPQPSNKQLLSKDISNVTLISGDDVLDLSSPKKITQNSKEIASNNNSTIDYTSSKNIDEQPLETRIIVPKKSSYQVKFEDGTLVTLNANSELKYYSKFSDNERVVTLIGEAFFDVAKESRPFIVKSGDAKIRVYGTKFNINTQHQGEIFTTLLSGSIGLSHNESEEVILAPNDMATLNTGNGTINVQVVDANRSISWINNEFYYRKSNLALLINDLSTWYGIEFNFSKDILENQKVTATFSRSMDADDIVSSLNKILDVKIIKINENQYEIK